jgi:signal transduction histidine kinase
MTIRFQLLTGFAILIAIFIVDFFVNQSLSRQVLTNTSFVSNSEMVIRNSNQLHKIVIDMQSGFRGYLLTDQESFLSNYNEGIRTYPRLMAEQRKLISNPEQLARLDSITFLHDKWLEYSEELIAAKLEAAEKGTDKYNKLFERRFRMEVGKILNDKIKNIFHEFDAEEYRLRVLRRSKLQASVDETRKITLTLTLVSIISSIAIGIFFTRNITNRIGKMVGLAEKISKGEFHSITDTKHDELQKLSQSLNRMSATLERNFQELLIKNKELDQFAYVVSHDLKAPLRGIANITAWIDEDHSDELSPAIQKNLNLIKGRTHRLENMINGLLEYARIGKVRKGAETVDVEQILKEIREELVPDKFRMNIKGTMPILKTEKLHIEQVFSNLISNAVKYNDKETGIIDISCTEEKEQFTFKVSDNGPGIQEEYFEKIFQIFQTLKERDAFESTGVGLAIVKKIIDDHKGKITVKSEYGTSTTFIFTWPKT